MEDEKPILFKEVFIFIASSGNGIRIILLFVNPPTADAEFTENLLPIINASIKHPTLVQMKEVFLHE